MPWVESPFEDIAAEYIDKILAEPERVRNPVLEQYPEAISLRALPVDTPLGTSDYVYFFRRDTDGAVKIGRSWRPVLRLKAVQRALRPARLTILAVMRNSGVPGAPFWEERLHRIFGASRLDGEWFAETAELRGFINWLGRTE